jgi:2-haloacid dehalogenase
VPQITAAVFDLGGVLIDWNPRHLYRKVFEGDEEAMEWFLGSVCTEEWNAQQDRGRPFAEAIAELSADHPDQRARIELYLTRWDEMLDGTVPGTEAVLRDVRVAGIPLHGLTNWSAETFPIAEARFPCLELFDGILISGREGVAKPDPRAFQTLCTRYRLNPSTCIFIDDSAVNVRAADAFGFAHAIDFTGAGDLRHRLRELGVLP